MGLRVIGAGFGRTGTNSLKLALEQLGFGPCHHMFELRSNRLQLDYWRAIAGGEAPNWDKVFQDYAAQVDWPGARYWRELADHFPDAKVVLTTRSPEQWFESIQATIYPFMRDRAGHPTEDMRARGEMAYELIVRQVFGGRMDDREHAISVFRAHIAEVQRSIPEDRILTYQISEGWRPLCRFLDVPTPATPIPHENTRETFDPLKPTQ